MLDLTFAQHATFTPAARMVPIFINKSFLAFHMSTVLSNLKLVLLSVCERKLR